jgi:two-component system, NarL family, invasion response regulator UvrY
VTRVLVIDDHPIVLQGCRQLLEDAGVHHIVEAQSLADGFRLYRVQRPDVIIVDLAMRTGALGGLSFIPQAPPPRSAHAGARVHHA